MQVFQKVQISCSSWPKILCTKFPWMRAVPSEGRPLWSRKLVKNTCASGLCSTKTWLLVFSCDLQICFQPIRHWSVHLFWFLSQQVFGSLRSTPGKCKHHEETWRYELWTCGFAESHWHILFTSISTSSNIMSHRQPCQELPCRSGSPNFTTKVVLLAICGVGLQHPPAFIVAMSNHYNDLWWFRQCIFHMRTA